MDVLLDKRWLQDIFVHAFLEKISSPSFRGSIEPFFDARRQYVRLAKKQKRGVRAISQVSVGDPPEGVRAARWSGALSSARAQRG
jgi:hypothetical protein